MPTPVIVGVGQVNDREGGADPLTLMAQALRLADADAGSGWLAAIESLHTVAQISFPDLTDIPARLAQAAGAAPRHCTETPYPGGESPVRLLHDAANRIGAGEITVAAVAGGEALRTAAARTVRSVAATHASAPRRRFGLVAPTDIYPLYENATRAAWGQTLAEATAETAAIWSRFSEVAAANDHAWLRRALPPEAIATPGPDNRPIAFPYLKLMVANAAVNQGAAFIVTSREAARARGMAEERLVPIGLGAAARESDDPLARDRYDRSASLDAVLQHTLAANAIDAGALDCVELYSCFPCIPKMARRVLGWPLDGPASVTGGLTFAGGPIGNYMSHAIATMVERLRGTGGLGLLFGNGGYATANHAIVLGRAGRFPQDYDVQAAADRGRPPAPPFREDAAGPATVETYTVLYRRDGAADRAVIVARTADGARTLAEVPGDDGDTIAFFTDGRVEPVGTQGRIEGQRWRP